MNAEHDHNREFAVEVVRTLQQAGYTALWAGGCVRDLLRGTTPKDYDVATDARPDTVRDLFGRRQTNAVGASFGVILVRGPHDTIEVATFRKDGAYEDGRRPTHVVFCTPEEDACRRDFTINGMFFDPITEQVFDYVGGQADLKRRIIRAIGDPHARFTEDKLRLLRAVRFAAALEFEIDPATFAAIQQMAPEIPIISAERITQELKRMLNHPQRVRALQLLQCSGLLLAILPVLAPLLSEPHGLPWRQTLDIIRRLREPGFELSLAALLHEVPLLETETAELITKRLRLSNDETEQILYLLARRDALRGIQTAPLSRLKRLLAEPRVVDLLNLKRAEMETRQWPLAEVEFCEEYLRSTPPEEINPPPLVSGNDLIRAGLRPGPQFKALLDQIRDAQLEGRLRTAGDAIEFAARLHPRPSDATK